MRFFKRSCWLLFFATTFSLEAAPTADEVIAHLVTRDKQLVEGRKGLDYDLDVRREKLDENDAVVETTKEHLVVTGEHRPDYNTRPGAGNPADESKKVSREEPFELLSMIDHFTYTLEGDEEVDGVMCYKVAFTAKPNMPYKNREEKVLNAVSGHIWAAKSDYSLVKDQGSLMHPVAVGWIFATLEKMQFQFDSMSLPNGDIGPKRVRYSYLVSIPFMSLHEQDTRSMSNYRATGTGVSSR